MSGHLKQIVPVLIILFLLCPIIGAEQKNPSKEDQFADIIQTVKPSIVCVGSYYFNDVPKNRFSGTGFVITNGKRVVTNYHVVQAIKESERLPYLRLFHKKFPRTGIRAKVVATDPFHDIAIIEHEGDALPALTLGDSSKVKEGYDVAFTGYPIGVVLGLNPTTHTGIISGVAPIIKPSPSARIIDGALIKHLDDPYEVFQVDAVALPGNSGSPLYRKKTGIVVGIINMVFVKGKKEHAISNPSGLTYAIPARFIIALEKQIKTPPSKITK